MSKCDIKILFDRKDRTYAGGEPVTGRVIIQVNQDVQSNGINLTHQWKTHGRGNVSVGPPEKIPLAGAGPLVEGETLELPFSVIAPRQPLTYRGTLINIDHYICVDVDVSWAVNPKAQEEYLLQVGQTPVEFTGTRNTVISLVPKPAESGLIVKIIVGVLLAVFGIALLSVSICLLPVILVVAGFFWLRSKALSGRLGEVQLTIPHVIAAPGDEWPLQLQFQPRKRFSINGISLTLTANESAVSGSGTTAKTTNHKLLEHRVEIRPAGILEADQPVNEQISMVFPETTAYSFDSTDNKVSWTAEVRIDIPRFPDWTKKQPLQVVPLEFVQNLPSALPSDGINVREMGSQTAVPLPVPVPVTRQAAYQESHDDDDDEDDEVDASPVEVVPQNLLELAKQLTASSRSSHARSDMIAAVLGQTFDATVVVDRINSTMGLTSIQPGYDGGKTIIGTVEGTDQAIKVLTPKSLNDSIDDLRRGDVWQLRVTIDSWDRLYNRINSTQII